MSKMLEDVAAGEAEREEVSEERVATSVIRFLAIVVFTFVLCSLISDTVEQKNWIKDLQRRVAELEQK